MVKSPSCFNIITCGRESAENDDLEVNEGKGSSDKRGWSFRKRSARHRVLSNTVTTETLAFRNKEGPESATVNFETQIDTTVSDKISIVHCSDEKPQLATVVKPEVPDTIVKVVVPDAGEKTEVDLAVKEVPEAVVKEVPDAVNEEARDELVTVENEHGTDAEIEESVVIVIQTAVRGFLAQRELLKLKKVVKLQAAVRGHIVRRHAVGTLRCVQAIVKMQVLVRARQARLSLDRSRQKSDTKEEENVVKTPSGLKTSIEKLLGNRFPRQMLESTPKTKPIHVKCDPSKSDSAWKWLERWMSASSVTAADSNKVVLVTEEQEKEKDVKFESIVETKIESEIICESVDSKCSSVHESVAPSESEDNLITYEADKFDFQACHYTTSTARDNLEQPEFEKTSTADVRENSADIKSTPNKDIQSHADSQIEPRSLYGEPEIEAEQPKRLMKRLASEELEIEGNKLVNGSKKASSISFLSAQSKFEELSSVVNSGQTMSSSDQEPANELHQDTISSEAQSVTKTTEISIAESPVHGNVSKIQVGGSECGTELSVTSTLDSPNRSDIGVMEHEPEAKVSEEGINDPSNVPAEIESRLSPMIPDPQEKPDAMNGESDVTPVFSKDSPIIEPNPETSDVQREQKSEAYVQAHVPSPQASPRSHITVPESQGTRSSQVSVKDGKKKSDKTGSGKKHASSSAIKKSPPSNMNRDSGSKSSAERPNKEQKNGKRRNSFGSTKPENGEQEPKDDSNSNNNNSLPHFMQVTESARAKLNANSSPRSSPDVHDGDNHIKKRHSLPGGQGSPRTQKSTSQAQNDPKVSERKWQR